ncbi:hypothetical protein [Altererythrobacter lutimaris]|uniref:Uncharacterized protein n=1 Tax=Altererythrobacter lutimaris TaxID=2743979 RepID=A0A850H911_9SPHN|nr:hypothetical protein [Altererythrobacter lutimaris]NVE93386.1 hypothetical protein [Altererythrobacter lutimaris]
MASGSDRGMKPHRTWVRPIGNFGFEVMAETEWARRHMGFRLNVDDANNLAREIHERSIRCIEIAEDTAGRKLEVPEPVLKLWEGLDDRPS